MAFTMCAYLMYYFVSISEYVPLLKISENILVENSTIHMFIIIYQNIVSKIRTILFSFN
jgi:hypothetical protein